MEKTKISIIIPVYNAEKFIKRNIVSMISQTMKDIEIIYVNDASLDNSSEIIRKYAKEDDRIKLLDLKKNLRQGGARNQGISIAKSEFIMFVDCDDVVDHTICEKMYSKVTISTDIVVCNINKINGDEINILQKLSKPQNLYSKEELKREMAFEFQPGPVGKLIRKEIITKNNLLFPEAMAYEDAAIVPLWFIYSREVKYIPESLYFYYLNTDSTTQKKSMRHFDRVKAMLYFKKKFIEFDRNSDYYLDAETYIIRHGWHYLLNACISHVPITPYNHIKDAWNKLGLSKNMIYRTLQLNRTEYPLHCYILYSLYHINYYIGNIGLFFIRIIHRLIKGQ